MVDKLMTTMFNLHGEPSQMHSEIGQMFLIDRGTCQLLTFVLCVVIVIFRSIMIMWSSLCYR